MLMLLLAAQAAQFSSAEVSAAARCIAVIDVASARHKSDASLAILDPQLFDRGIAFAGIVAEDVRVSGKAQDTILKAVDAAKAEITTGPPNDARLRGEVERCGTMVDERLGEIASRLTPSETTLREHLKCLIVYSMTYGVAYRPDTPEGRYGARIAKFFQNTYDRTRFGGGEDEATRKRLWNEDYEQIMKESLADPRANTDQQDCVLLSMASTHQ